MCDAVMGGDSTMIGGDDVQAYILEREEEMKYWDIAENMKRARENRFRESSDVPSEVAAS